MGWRLDDDEMERVLALDVDDRYAYAINKIAENGELWTLKSEGGWVISSHADGVSSIPIWPHERFAKREAVAAWTDAEPTRVPLEGEWLSVERATWFDERTTCP